MPVRKPAARGPRAGLTAKRAPTLRPADLESAKLDARHRLERAKRIAQLGRDIAALKEACAALRVTARKLVRDNSGSVALRACNEASSALSKAMQQLIVEVAQLAEQPTANSPKEALTAALLERGVSRREAARIVGGHGAHVGTDGVAPGEREAARRTALKLEREIRAWVSHLRALRDRPSPWDVDPAYVDGRIAELERRLAKLAAK